MASSIYVVAERAAAYPARPAAGAVAAAAAAEAICRASIDVGRCRPWHCRGFTLSCGRDGTGLARHPSAAGGAERLCLCCARTGTAGGCRRRRRQHPSGPAMRPLAGIPIAVKDLAGRGRDAQYASSPVLADRVETKDASSIRASRLPAQSSRAKRRHTNLHWCDDAAEQQPMGQHTQPRRFQWRLGHRRGYGHEPGRHGHRYAPRCACRRPMRRGRLQADTWSCAG